MPFFVVQCVCLLLSATKWSYPLHTLIAREELHLFLSYAAANIPYTANSTDSADLTTTSTTTTTTTRSNSLEWRRRTLQNLCVSILYYGEVRPCSDFVRALGSKKPAAKPGKEKPPLPKVVAGTDVRKRESSARSLIRQVKLKREKKAPVHYSTFIISNSVECRRAFMPDSLPELQLQKIAKGVYGSILLSLLNARPLTPSICKPVEDPMAVDAYLQELDPTQPCCVFPETLFMLVDAMEHLLTCATSGHHLLNSVDLLAVLSLWHEVNEILATPSNPSSDLYCIDAPQQQVMTSERCCSVVVDYLLAQTSLPPTLWQSALVNILAGLHYHLRKSFLDYDKLLMVLVKFFVSPHVTLSDLVPRIVQTLLGEEKTLASPSIGGEMLSGNSLLLESLITALQIR